MRSLVVYFLSFIVIGGIVLYCSNISPAIAFPLAFIPAFFHGLFMVRYRRREHIQDPTISATWRHFAGLHTLIDEDTISHRGDLAEKTLNILVIFILSLVFTAASTLYDSLTVFWFPVLALATGASAAVLFREKGRTIITPIRFGILFLVISALGAVHYLALGYPPITVVIYAVIAGGITGCVLLVWMITIKQRV